MAEHLLEIKNLKIHYITHGRTVEAVNGISFTLEKGETLGLVGETGAGKTTTALGILGLVPDPPGKILDGEVFFEGRDLRKLHLHEMRKIRGNRISMIFQDPMTSLNPVITVGDQIVEVIRNHKKISRAEAVQEATRLLAMVGIQEERFHDYPHQFSGGMKQRVVIAIALACNPALLIADEPTTALDVTIQAQVLELMEGLKKELDTSMILITHDLGIVAEVCDKVAIIYAGEIVESGTLEQIYNDTKHPYTVGLFESIPSLDEKVDRLKPIHGLMPDPANLPAGCTFAPRCGKCMEICGIERPEPFDMGAGHMVKCHLYQSPPQPEACGR